MPTCDRSGCACQTGVHRRSRDGAGLRRGTCRRSSAGSRRHDRHGLHRELRRVHRATRLCLTEWQVGRGARETVKRGGGGGTRQRKIESAVRPALHEAVIARSPSPALPTFPSPTHILTPVPKKKALVSPPSCAPTPPRKGRRLTAVLLVSASGRVGVHLAVTLVDLPRRSTAGVVTATLGSGRFGRSSSGGGSSGGLGGLDGRGTGRVLFSEGRASVSETGARGTGRASEPSSSAAKRLEMKAAMVGRRGGERLSRKGDRCPAGVTRVGEDRLCGTGGRGRGRRARVGQGAVRRFPW